MWQHSGSKNKTVMKTIYSKISIFFAILLLAPIFVQAQQSSSNLSVNASTVIESRHYWRGIPVSTAPTFTGSLSLAAGNFTAGYWGGYSFDNTYAEFDFFMSYSIGNFSISLWDLYVDLENDGSYDKYWNFTDSTTTHNFDLTLSYRISNNFPLTTSLSTMVYGADGRMEDGEYKQNYSTYLEFSYPVQINENDNLNFFLGSSIMDEPNAYGTGAGFGVVHTGVMATKSIKVSEQYSIPVTATIAMNPQSEFGYFVLQLALL